MFHSMLKKFFSIAAVAMLFAACEIVEVEVESVPGPGSGMFTVGASFENNLTKSDISETGVFTWSTGDAINVRSDLNRWNILTIMEQSGQSLGPKFSNANFTTSSFVGSCVSQAAVFPQTVDARIDNETLYIKLPKEIVWNESSLEGLTESTMQADNIMVARFEDGANNLAFKNVGGLFRLTLNNIPVNACKLVFSANQKISGEFAVSTVKENNIEYPIINTSDSYAEAEGENQVTITFATVTTEAAKKVFFIPVPVGTYHIGFAVKDVNDNVLWEFNSNADNYVARAHMKKMPTLSKITIGGGGEGATNIIVTPTGYSGDVILPNTTSDIQVQMNETAGTISLVYSSAEGAKHPANVYLQALGDIAGLNINLKDSHVELTGNGNTVQIITEVTASTNINTFVVDNKVQIGKKENDVPVGGLTISGGSLVLNAPVAGTVSVNIPDENVNSSDKKVSIEINSAINNLEVPKAATKNNPDKVWVSINSGASVTTAIDVDETNCNLYIAPEASATTVTTSAAENTISGSVGTINAATSSTEGAPAPTVTVTSGAEVTGDITAVGGAEIFIEGGVSVEGETNADEDSSITVFGNTDVARIGSTGYPSLAAAFEEGVTGGETITLLKDIELTSTEEYAGKGFVLDGAGHTFNSANAITTTTYPLAFGDADFSFTNVSFVSAWTATNKQNYNVLIYAENENATAHLSGVTISSNQQTALCVQGWNSNITTATLENVAITNTGSRTGSDAYRSAAVATAFGGKVIINSGSYSSEYQAVRQFSSGGDITINGGTFSGKIVAHLDKGSYSQYPAIITINGGTFNNCSFEVIHNNGDTTANIIIYGGTFDCDPSAYVAPGCVATKSGNVWTVAPAGVAAIGSTAYATLAEAIEAAANGQTIKILKNFTIEGNAGVTIPAGKSITIDLNGKNIKNRVTEDAQSQLILNNGTLTITDSSNNPGTMSNEIANGVNPGSWSSHNYSTSIIYNTGTVTVEKGTIREVAGGGSANICFAIDNVGANTSLTVNGGTLEAGYIPVRSYIGQNKTVAIHGGTLTGLYDIYLQSATTLNIDGGSFNAPTRTIMYVEGASSVDISGDAVFNYASDRQFIAFDNDSAESGSTVSVTGGTYSSDPSTYVSAGYGAFQSGNVWTVQQLTASNAAAQIGSTFYATLPAAFNAAQNGDTITVLSNTDLPATINVAKQVTLDLNSKTLSNTADLWAGGNWSFFSVKAGGNLTVTGNGTIDAKENDCYTFDVQNGGSLTIKNGTFTGNISCVYLINKAGTGVSTCNIEGGHFSIKQLDNSDPYHLLLNSLDADYTAGLTNFVVTGGSFEHFNPAASTSEPGSPVSFVPDGYYATEENDTWTVLEETNVAQIGGTKYATLAEAIEAAEAGQNVTIKMLNNCTIEGNTGVTIPANKNITLDLNGKNVKNLVTATTHSQVITNNGVLTIMDSSAGASGVLSNEVAPNVQPGNWSEFNYATNVILNTGSLTVQSGTLQQTALGNICYAIDNRPSSKDATITLYGGVVRSAKDGIRVWSNSTVYGSNVIIPMTSTVLVESTDVESGHSDAIWLQLPSSTVAGKANISIAGGTLRSNYLAFGDWSPNNDIWGNVSYTFSGGTFQGGVSTKYVTGFITGGTYTVDPSAYVANGHIAIYSATTHMFTVESAEFWEDVAVSDAEFASITDENNKTITISTAEQLAKLAKNVNAHEPGTAGFIYKGYTVNLTADIDLAGKIWTPIGVCSDWTRGHFTGTFNGNGHTISNLKVVREDRAGLFGSIYGEAVIKDLNVTNVTLIANHFAAGIVGWINEENYDLVVDNCTVVGGTITLVPNFVNNEWDNGDKCGGIVGYSNQNTANHCRIINNTASNLTITAYRDLGGIVGYCKGNVYVGNNTVSNVTLVQDNFHAYKSSVTTVNQIVGRNDGSTQENNTATGVVINTVN